MDFKNVVTDHSSIPTILRGILQELTGSYHLLGLSKMTCKNSFLGVYSGLCNNRNYHELSKQELPKTRTTKIGTTITETTKIGTTKTGTTLKNIKDLFSIYFYVIGILILV
jgi:hypothetical protein